MRLRKFLVCIGIWVALLPYLGFSILTENVLFSITGFLLIISSFYVAAIEDKHRHKRVIREETLEEATQKMTHFLHNVNPLKKSAHRKTEKNEAISTKIEQQKESVQAVRREGVIKEFPKAVPENVEGISFEADDGRPRIRKAVSDVKIKTDSIDEIVS